MNLDLEALLAREGIAFERLTKAEKVRWLTRWSAAFPGLMAAARRGQAADDVARDRDADALYAALETCDFVILPDDASAMQSCACFDARPPDLASLVSDTFTKCDELVVAESDLRWSAVFVNHGSPTTVARHFAWTRTGPPGD